MRLGDCEGGMELGEKRAGRRWASGPSLDWESQRGGLGEFLFKSLNSRTPFLGGEMR